MMTTPTPSPVHAKRIGPTLVPNRSRVLMRPFYPFSDDIARRVIARVMALPDEEIAQLLGRVLGAPAAVLGNFTAFASGTSTELALPATRFTTDKTPAKALGDAFDNASFVDAMKPT